MVKREFTGLRDHSYSEWHRTIGDPFHMMDLDSIEWRSDRGIVAFIETTIFDNQGKFKISEIIDRKQFELKVFSELREKTHISTYLVLHTPDLKTFWIFNIKDEAKAEFWRCLGIKEYTEFIQHL